MDKPSNSEAYSAAPSDAVVAGVQGGEPGRAPGPQAAPPVPAAVGRPDRSEYAEYYDRYISLVPDGDIVTLLARQLPETRGLLDAVPADRETWAYGPGKWSFREVVGHLVDTERVFSGRALWIARDPETPLPSMEQDAWAARSGARERPLRELLDEWSAVRAATVALVRSFDGAMLARTGTASGVRFTVRSFPWIIAGHELHHRRLFRERYGLGGPEAA